MFAMQCLWNTICIAQKVLKNPVIHYRPAADLVRLLESLLGPLHQVALVERVLVHAGLLWRDLVDEVRVRLRVRDVFPEVVHALVRTSLGKQS